MEYKLFGVWVVSKGAEKTFFNLVMIQMMRTFHIPIDLNLIDEALAKATTMALIKWAPWLHDIIYKKTILNRCDWCKISKCCDMIDARYIPQCGDLIGTRNIPLYTPTQRFFFAKKKDSKRGLIIRNKKTKVKCYWTHLNEKFQWGKEKQKDISLKFTDWLRLFLFNDFKFPSSSYRRKWFHIQLY